MKTLTSKQIGALAVGGVAAVLILLLLYMFAYKPQMAAISQAHADKAQAASQTKSLTSKLAELKQQQENIEQTTQQVNTLYASFPTKSDQAAWIDMVNSAASDAKVKPDSISPGIPQLGPGSAKADGNSSSSTSASSSSSTSSSAAPPSSTATSAPSTSSASGAAAPTGSAATTTGSEDTLANVPVSLSVTGSDAAIRDFLSRVNKLDQPLLIDTFTVSASDGELTANVTGRVILSREITPPVTVKAK